MVVQAAIPVILERLLVVMGQTECEQLSVTMQHIVSEFGEQILPFASQLIQQLCVQFLRLSEDEDDEEASLAAMETIQTIVSILRSCTENRPVFREMEPHMYDMLDKLTQPEGLDFLEEGCDILAYMLFYTETISPRMWRYFPRLCQAMVGGSTPSLVLPELLEAGWAPDGMVHLLAPLDC